MSRMFSQELVGIRVCRDLWVGAALEGAQGCPGCGKALLVEGCALASGLAGLVFLPMSPWP